jgi:hypothetical protein
MFALHGFLELHRRDLPAGVSTLSFHNAMGGYWKLPTTCASTIQIVCPSRSTAERQLQLHAALLRLSAMFPNTSLRLFRRILLKAAKHWLLFDVRLYRTYHSGVG